MTGWFELFFILQVLGAVVGAFGATSAELVALRAIAKGKASGGRTRYLKAFSLTLRAALPLFFLGMFGSMFFGYQEPSLASFVFTPEFWVAQTLIIVLLIDAQVIRRRGWEWIGSTVSLVSWYAILALLLGFIEESYFETVLGFLIAMAGVDGVLRWLRAFLQGPLPRALSS